MRYLSFVLPTSHPAAERRRRPGEALARTSGGSASRDGQSLRGGEGFRGFAPADAQPRSFAPGLGPGARGRGRSRHRFRAVPKARRDLGRPQRAPGLPGGRAVPLLDRRRSELSTSLLNYGKESGENAKAPSPKTRKQI